MRESKKLRLLCLAALFAGAIAVTTAYLLHIPIPTGGYIHLGDALIYLAACLLPAPTPWAPPWWGPGWRICSPRPCGWSPRCSSRPWWPSCLPAGDRGSSAPGTGGPSAGLPALPGGVRPGRLPAAGRRQRLLAPVPGHAGTGGGQRGGLCRLGAGPGPGRR
ncbi:MAG: hypothetical protein ACLRIS_18100 [Flavonifractor plautii]